ncbi:hypothetical protein BRD01_10720 [Halobacteriales archaeon QS_8_65_32]|jgi:hypothetical protein|nr:MAG: hypothetical protein BRD01_10720 [Halobacteriales archaeon QS_8_65_32]
MRSSEHLLASVPATALALAAVRRQCSRTRLAILGAYGLGLGVFIDLDHFLIARVYAGDWHHLTGALRNPIAAFSEQEGIFDDIRDMMYERLLTHVLVGGVLIGLAEGLSRPLAVVTAVVLHCHLLCDFLRDNRIL